jgi:sigma-B regulation protein RsbU (phosphoserine phosphatase)
MIRAMIVDDERPARDRMRQLLAGSAVEIVGEAADGESALASIDRLGPDVIFLDIQMPQLSGLDVAARLRAPRPRVVFCTAFDEFALDAFEHHALDYLLKPVNRDRLLRTVDRLAGDVSARQRQARERGDAAGVQSRLMPSPSLAAGLECAAVCRPADGVGGDYYDVLPMNAGRLGLAVGDVSGKGMYAAILGAAVQARLQALAARGGTDPSALLAELNQLTIGSIEEHRFVTLALAVHAPAASTLHFASAGHPPGIVLSAGGGCRLLDATGPVIGWPGAHFTTRSERVETGDLVALYSDGISETRSPAGQELGTSGLVDLLRRFMSLPSAGIVDGVLAELERFSGGAPAEDDRTLLVARIP